MSVGVKVALGTNRLRTYPPIVGEAKSIGTSLGLVVSWDECHVSSQNSSKKGSFL